MDYVPTSEDVKRSLPEFIIAETTVEGLYANMDVDSMMFRYEITTQTGGEILPKIIENAERDGWLAVERMPQAVRFSRVRSSGRLFSSEEARIVIAPRAERVYVAWVQADSAKQVSRFEDTGEAEYARRVVWPMLESYIAQEQKRSSRKDRP